ncbi:MAG TPA: T9SS type A sorting domain-containing protein, partial [Bacteroidota bacterium]
GTGYGGTQVNNFVTIKYQDTGPVAVEEEASSVPEAFELAQNYPNPFNPTTRIKYQIPNDNYVTLKVFDILGREVRTLVNETRIAGEHEVTFDAYGLARQTAGGLASGIYFYRITAGEFRQAKKLILLR